MCKLCDEGNPQDHSDSLSGSRRDFLKVSAATGAAATGLGLFSAGAAADPGDRGPGDTGRRDRRYVIRGGHVMSMDPAVGDFARADVRVEGKKIVALAIQRMAADLTAEPTVSVVQLPSDPRPLVFLSRQQPCRNRLELVPRDAVVVAAL